MKILLLFVIITCFSCKLEKEIKDEKETKEMGKAVMKVWLRADKEEKLGHLGDSLMYEAARLKRLHGLDSVKRWLIVLEMQMDENPKLKSLHDK